MVSYKKRALHAFFVASFAVLGLAWLVPNHYLPWSSFWSELLAGLALAGIFFSLAVPARPVVSVPRIAIGAALLSLVPLLQVIFGLIHFSGDGWMAALYVLGWALAMACFPLAQSRFMTLSAALAWTVLAAALVSLLLALLQWLGLEGLGLLLADLPPNGRPHANLAQPNQLATLLMLGVVSACGLHQFRQLSGWTLAVLLLLLTFGVAMTQSRAAWLEMAVLGAGALALRQRAGLRLGRSALLALLALLAAWVVLWPALNEALYLMAGRSLQDQQEFGKDLRGPMWLAMLDAISRQPWLGYGWNQVSVAQHRVAADHPALGEMTEHSHNLALDLLVWNGVPLGLLVLLGLAYWFWTHLRACRDPAQAWLLGGIGVVLVHGLLEFPLEYAYFLLPVGLMMGAVEQRSPAGRFLVLPRWGLLAPAWLALTLLAWTLIEYVKVEAHHRQLRFELAGYGQPADPVSLDGIVLLSQLREFPKFARTLAQRGMGPEALEQMRKMAERYGYPPVLFRYALAAALNGRPDVAQHQLVVLCKLHTAERCEEGRQAWAAMAQGAYPELQAVPWPAGARRP